jgi:phosphoenolpyruvate carboxykinase (ATP)
LNEVEYDKLDVFGISVPKTCPGVPDEILMPKSTWDDKKGYDSQLKELARMMQENFG